MTLAAPLALAALATLVGCASLPPCPAKGGPAWRELSSDHFVVRTDLDAPDGDEVVRRLEETRAAMLAAVWPQAPGPPDRTPVIALRSQGELSEFVGLDIEGEYVHMPPFPKTMIIAGDAGDDVGLVALRHELAHHLSDWFLPLQTPWYAEGLASFLETVRYDRQREQAVMGEPLERRYRFLIQRGLISIERLLADGPPDPDDLARFEASSWLLVHYLINHKNEAFEGFQHRMGAFEPPDQAWAKAFPDIDRRRLWQDLAEYAETGHYVTFQLRVARWQGAIAARTLSDAEVHGARAFLYAAVHAPGEPPALKLMRAEIAEALREDPAQPEATALRYYVRDPSTSADRPELARRASQAHPEDWMAWLMVADAPGTDGPTRQDALARALLAAPNQAEVLTRMALLKAGQNRWREVLPVSSKALRLGAIDDNLLLAHMIALWEAGSCREAAFYAAGARARLPPARVEALAPLWTRLRIGCARLESERDERPASRQGD